MSSDVPFGSRTVSHSKTTENISQSFGGLQSYLDVRNQRRTEQKNNQLLQSLAVTCTFYEKEGARASCQQDTLCNCGGLPTSTTTVKNANHTVGTHRSMLKPSPPWITAMARHTERAMTCQTYPPSSSNFKSNALLLERYFPKLAVHNGRGSHSTDRMCLSMLRFMNTQSCGRETPCGKSPCHTRVGPQSRFSAELRTTLTICPF